MRRPNAKWPWPTHKSVSPGCLLSVFPAFRQGGWQRAIIAKLANASSLFWGLGANVAQEIFTGGARSRSAHLRVPAMTRMSRLPANCAQCVSRSARRITAVRFDSGAANAAASGDSARRTLIFSPAVIVEAGQLLDVVTAQRDLLANEQQLAIIEGQRSVSSCVVWLKPWRRLDASSWRRAGQPKPKDIITP